MPLTAEALSKLREASRKGVSLSKSSINDEGVKTLEYILEECKGLGFNSSFCDFIKSLHLYIIRGSKRSKDKIIEEFKQKKAVNAERLAELIILMEKNLRSDASKNFGFRLNQLIALCAFLVPMQV